ncbi:Gfo/Idh/MocA family oxidoreductase [Rhodobacteraceae bacterium XHP0102]|nr:Gfo/Idh/MocA family oxidoreductase [Rhodobacteraceae bacterium XHP0102]
MLHYVNWGILGASNFALNEMAPALHLAGRGRLAGIATRDVAKAAPFARIAPDLSVHDSYEALLADPLIDAVYIPLPHTMHVEWGIKALQAGKHVLVEKPTAMQADEITPLIEARDKSGLVASEAFMIVHHPQWHMAREIITSEQLGTLQRVRAAFTYNNASDTQNIRNKAAMGGGSLPDIGVYTIGSTRFATGGALREIYDAKIEYEGDCEVTAEARAGFDGFDAHWLTSMRMHPFQEVTFHGSAGVLRVPTPYNAGVFDQARLVIETGMERREIRFPKVNQYVLQVENLNAAILDGAALKWRLEDAVETQETIDAIRAKAG